MASLHTLSGSSPAGVTPDFTPIAPEAASAHPSSGVMPGDSEHLSGTAHLPPAALDASIEEAWAEHARLWKEAEHLEGEAYDAAAEKLHAVGDLIRDTPALSLEGIGIKSSWALMHTVEGEQDLSSVLRQVEAFAHRHRKPAKMTDVPHLERDAMAGLPAADWPLYHLFVRWLESANESRALDADWQAVFDREGDQTDAYRLAEVAASEAAERNRALRAAIVEMPAASPDGVRLKACVYAWLCRTGEDVEGNTTAEDNVTRTRHDGPASDEVLAFAIARDLARLGPPDVLKAGSRTSAAPVDAAAEQARVA